MKEPLFQMLDEALRDQVHQCLEAHAPELQQQLLEGLGMAQDDIGRLRTDWANQIGIGPDFQPIHRVKPYLLEFEADAGEVFPLLCPVRENDWLAGWESVCRVLHSDSGFAEEGCVFSTLMPEEGRAVWLCSDYDRAACRIEYIKHIEGKAIVKWQMRVEQLEPRHCVLISRYAMTGLSEAGNQWVSKFMAEGYPHMLESILKEAISYYLKAGEMLPSEKWQPLQR